MKPDIFEIFRTFSRYLEKNFETLRKKFHEFPETYLDFFFVIFVSRPMWKGFCSLNSNPHS